MIADYNAKIVSQVPQDAPQEGFFVRVNSRLR